MKSRDQRRLRTRRLALTVVATALAVAVVAPVGSAATPKTKLVSTTTGGAQTSGGWSHSPSISANGRYVAFTTKATNLAAGDADGFGDVYLKDMKTGKTTWLSYPKSGPGNDGENRLPSISASGRFVAFDSEASTIIDGDTNGFRDVFIQDVRSSRRKNKRISVNTKERQAKNGDSTSPSVSETGRFVAFASKATNLVKKDTNGRSDIFVRDRKIGKTTRVSIRSNSKQAWGGDSSSPSISANGRWVAFESEARNLVSRDTNGKSDIFVHDRATGKTRRVSVRSNGKQANSFSAGPSISADGRHVAFDSLASNLVKRDTNGDYDVFVHDLPSRKTWRASIRSDGGQAIGSDSWVATISATGRYVAFMSYATNLFPNDLNGEPDAFVRDRKKGKTRLLSVNRFGVHADHRSGAPRISADGRFAAFRSAATDIVSSDANGLIDVFRRGPMR